MVPAVNPVIFAVNDPVPNPLIVLVSKSIVGLAEVLQTIPLSITASSLAAVIFPPAVAETFVMADAAVVDKVEIGVISIGSVLIVSDANSSYDPDWIADQ